MKKLIAVLIIAMCSVAFAADTKLSDLTKLAQGNDDLLVYVVTDPNGSPLDRKIPWEELILPWVGSTNITTLGTIATGTWQGTAIDHERGGIEANISAIADGGILVGTGAGTMAVRATALTTGAAGYIKHELGGVEADISAIADGGMLVGTGAGTMAIRASALTGGAAGFIKHEIGGLEADINAYTGLVAITGGSTAEVDSLDELEGQLADVTRIVTEAVMPVASTDPDVDAAGELSVDTDGANEPNDVILRTIDGNGTQVALAQEQKSFQGTIIKPNDLADATRDACPFLENNTGMSFIITKIRAWSDTTATTFNVETVDSDWDNNATVNAMEIDTAEVVNFSTEDKTITASTITNGSLIVLDFDDTDDPGWVKISICGYFLADVD